MVRTRSGKSYGGDGGNNGGQRQTRSEPEQGPSKRANINDSKKENSGELQKILIERKATLKCQAERRRLHGLTRIGERNSRTGVDPLSHFPKEIWLQIVNELAPSDKGSLSEVHPLYRQLMERNRIGEILFPQVLDHKTRFVQEYFNDSESYSDLLKLRGVSKVLQDAVNKWFEDDFNNNLKTVKDPFPDWTRPPFMLKMSFDDEELDKIREIRKPLRIVQRELKVKILCPGFHGAVMGRGQQYRRDYFDRFKANVTHALEQIGDQFWRFVFYSEGIDEYGVSRSQVYSFLNEWLHRLPNIKLIDICFNDEVYQENGSERINESLLNREPFPTLIALEGLRFSTFTQNELFPICDAIIASNPHVKMFDFGQDGVEFDYLMSLPRVQSLKLESCHFAEPNYSKILNAPKCNWNLKRMDFHELLEGSTLNVFFMFLNNFPTLEILYLGDFQITFGMDRVNFLRLPNLRHFGIVFRSIDKAGYGKNIHFFMSLQFLIHSTKLESIMWLLYSSECYIEQLGRQIKAYERTNQGAMLDFGGGFEDLTNSNLWQAFPNLERIHVKSKREENVIYRKTRSLIM